MEIGMECPYMAHKSARRTGASSPSTLASRRSIRRALGFMGGWSSRAQRLSCCEQPVGDLVPSGFELRQLLGREARAHYPQAIADTRTDLTIEGAVSHRANCLLQALRDLI